MTSIGRRLLVSSIGFPQCRHITDIGEEGGARTRPSRGLRCSVVDIRFPIPVSSGTFRGQGIIMSDLLNYFD